MKLKTPVTGSIVEVQDDKAQLYIEKGFVPAEPKKSTRKRNTKRKE